MATQLHQIVTGCVVCITSATTKPTPKRVLAQLWERLKHTEPGLGWSVRDSKSGLWYRGTKLTPSKGDTPDGD